MPLRDLFEFVPNDGSGGTEQEIRKARVLVARASLYRDSSQVANFLPLALTLKVTRQESEPYQSNKYQSVRPTVSRTGLEPVTKGLKGPCSAN